MRPPCFVAICSKPSSPRPTRASTVMKHSRPWIDKAARLAFGIAQAQAYQDGNKRLAWLCTVTFLEVNGTSIDVDQDEAASVIRALGKQKTDGSRLLNLAGLTNWFIECVHYSNESA